MAADEKWYFTKEQLGNTPSRKCGYDADKELSCRQQAANFIQDMGQRLQVTQLCINTAIVYMHRFYMFHSFTRFHRNAIAAAALFLAAKVEEQPRKLEHVIKVAQICLHREQPPLDIKSEVYAEHAQDLVMNENVLLQTLGFDVAIDHPHTHVVRCCHLVRASKDLAQTSYFMASNSLHLTTMCLQYKPTVVACFCIHLACKWSNWEIPQSNEGKPWFWYVDRSVTQELLEQLTEEFLAIFEKCPSRLKRKIMSLSSNQNSTMMSGFSMEVERRSQKGGNEVSQFGSGPTQIVINPQVASGSNSTSSTSSAIINSCSEELKKKMEIAQRPPPDYKKPHSSHHPRMEGHGVIVPKPSCVFAPPHRAHHGSSHMNSNSSSSTTTTTTTSSSSSSSSSSRAQGGAGQHWPSGGGTRLRPNSDMMRNSATQDSKQNNRISGSDKVQSGNSDLGFLQQPPPPIVMDLLTPPPKLLTPIDSMPRHTPPVKQKSPPPPTPPPPLPPPPPPPPAQVKIERSIFSPEKMTPPPQESLPSTPLPSTPSLPETKPNICSPPPVAPLTPGKSSRKRNSSSSSEPELVPVTHKIEEVSGFEALGKGKTSIRLPGRIPDLIQPIKDGVSETPLPAEEKPPDLIKPLPEPVNSEEVHAKEHKKKKKKHKEGKHKEKHKDKHKHKHKNRDPEPIVITIPKEKIILQPAPPDQGLKIKIAKEKISPSPTPLKIKIPKDKIKESRKRDRSQDGGLPASKHHRPNGTTLQVNDRVDIVDRSEDNPSQVISVDYNSNVKMVDERAGGWYRGRGGRGRGGRGMRPEFWRPHRPQMYPGFMRPPRFPPYQPPPPHLYPPPPSLLYFPPLLVPSYPPPPPLPDEPPPLQPPPPPDT